MPGTDSYLRMADIKEELRQAQSGASQLRESVVMFVMRRNKLADDVTRLERLIADLETKATLAERINNGGLAGELRAERARREAELQRTRALFQTADAEAEAAKVRLPEDEIALRQRINNLQSQIAAMESGRLMDSLTSDNSDALFQRAADKTRDLQAEASARREVATGSSDTAPSAPALTPDESAEKMLAELEARNASQSSPAPEPESATRYLELDVSDAAPALPAEIYPAFPAFSETPPEILAAPTLTLTPAESAPAEIEIETETSGAAEPAKLSLAELPVAAEIPPASEPKTFLNISSLPKRTSVPDATGRVRVAGIGTGGIFRGAHLPAYVDISQMQLVALCDPDKEAQDLAYRRYQVLMEAKIKQANDASDFTRAERLERDLEAVQICEDLSEVIETVKPDVVDICTQPFLHAPLSIQALEAGIHVMCEKPISRSWLESQRVIEAVERTGKLYQHNENWLWDKDYYTAKKLIDSGAIGEPILMFLATAHGGPEGNPKFWDSDFGGGGALLDNGIHAIGAAWFMSGLDRIPTLVKTAEPFGMSIRMSDRILEGRYQKVQVEDDAHILVRFEHPESLAWTTAHIEGSWSHRDSPDTAIIGSTGKIVFHDEGGSRYALVMDSYDRESRRIEVSGPTWSHWPSSHYGEILNFINCVKHNTPSICDAKFGAECSAIVGASYLSEQRGRKAVHVEEFKQFARDLAAKYPNDPAGADNALVDALLAAVRKS